MICRAVSLGGETLACKLAFRDCRLSMAVATDLLHQVRRLPINLDSVLFSATPFEPPHQSEAWCTTIHMKMSLICMGMKSHFHTKGWAPRLALRKRLKVIRKWRISSVCQTHYCLFTSFKSLVELSIFLRVFTISGKETKSSQMAENLIHWLHYCHWFIFITPGACFSKAPETFRARKAIFRSSVCKNGEAHRPETSCMKWTSPHIKKM